MHYKSEVEGKGGIIARVVAKSSSTQSDDILTTWEVEYPRIVHSELMTHKMLSKNASSSRAIPTVDTLKRVWNDPAMPVQWGKNQPGMQAEHELSEFKKSLARFAWRVAAKMSCAASYALHKLGAHKQVCNRITEPFQFIKVVITGTEIENFFWLRCHRDADPTIKELADCMLAAYEKAGTTMLAPGDWHVPYFKAFWDTQGAWFKDCAGAPEYSPLNEAMNVSSSCCAQASYRKLDMSSSKASKMRGRLTEGERVHASPFEHQGTPISNSLALYEQPGITHADVNDFSLWSANFRGFIQHRQLIPNHVKTGREEQQE